MSIEKTLRVSGTFLVFVAVGFLLYRFWLIRHSISDWQLTAGISFYLVLSSFAYAFVCILHALAWHKLLIYFGQSNIRFKDSFSIYARTQIARYIPGNVFHLPGRHLVGGEMGLGHASLAGANLFEIVGILISTSTLALVGYTLFDIERLNIPFLEIGLIITITALFPIIFHKIADHTKILNKVGLPNKTVAEIIRELPPIYFLYLLFFIALAGIFLNLAYIVSGVSSISKIGQVITIFAVAVIVGFITPGAPGGLGVREAIIVGLLGRITGESQSLFVALLFRIITISGDVLFFLSSFAWGKHPRKSIELPDYDRE